MSLEDDRVRVYTSERLATDRGGKRLAKRREVLAHQPGLADRLATDSGVIVFDAPRASITANCRAFGQIIKLHVAGGTRAFWLNPQTVGDNPILFPILVARIRHGRKGRKALASRPGPDRVPKSRGVPQLAAPIEVKVAR